MKRIYEIMKKFVTLFARARNVELVKDVGMIPYMLGIEGYYDTKLVTCAHSEHYEYLDNEVKGLKVEFIKKIHNNILLSELKYLFQNAKKIDILNLYHLKLSCGLEMIIYKILNPKGKCYLKLDIDYRFFEKSAANTWWKKRLYKKMIQKADFCSAESSKICKVVENYSNKKIFYVPNGYYENDYLEKIEKRDILNGYLKEEAQKDFVLKLNQYRQNYNGILLTVGRLGTEQKNNELLLEAFAKSCEKQNFALFMVGTIENKFKNFLEDYFCRYPYLKERIFFIGHIKDKRILNYIYKISDIFVLTSRWEGFPLVIPEAMKNGCYLILTDSIYPAFDIIKNDTIGQIVKTEDKEQLGNLLPKLYENLKEIRFLSDGIEEYCKENYEWKVICKKIYEKLEL